MTPVLISYSRRDMIFADRLVEALESRGFRVLIDRRDLPDLVQWQQELLHLIRQADTVVFIVSPRSIESKVCAWELAQIAALNKRLAPIVLEKVDDDKIPDPISKINYLFFDPPNHFASQADRLAVALDTDIDWWHHHTRLVGAAVRWDESGHPEGQLLSSAEISVALSWERRRPDNALLPDIYTSFLDGSIKNDELAREELNARERRISRQAQRLIAEAAHRTRQMRLDESAIRIALAAEPTGPELTRGITAEAVLRAEIAAAAHALRIVKCLSGHCKRVVSAVFGPDGSKVLTASDDKTARIWDAESGDEIIRLEHDAKVNIATFSSDGSRVLTASDDKTSRVWDSASGQEIVRFDHSRPVTSAAFSRDDTLIVTVPFDTSLVWNVEYGTETARLNHNGAGAGAAFSEDGSRVVTTALDNTARVWDASTGAEIARLTHGDVVILSAAFSPDGALVVAAGSLGGDCAYVWDIASGAEIARLKHEGEVGRAMFSHDGSRVITASQDSTARIWDPLSGVEIARFPHSDGVSDAVLSPDSTSLLTWAHSNVAGLWDTTWAIRLTGDELVHAVVRARLVGQNLTTEELKAIQPVIGETSPSPFERWIKSSSDDTDIAVILAQWRTRRKSAVAVAGDDWTFRAAQIRAGFGASSAGRIRSDEERIS